MGDNTFKSLSILFPRGIGWRYGVDGGKMNSLLENFVTTLLLNLKTKRFQNEAFYLKTKALGTMLINIHELVAVQ